MLRPEAPAAPRSAWIEETPPESARIEPADGVDLQRIAAAVREILAAVGEDPDREGLRHTPLRVARMYAEVFSGLREDPKKHLQSFFTEKYDELVVLRDVPFHSMCEHHLLPFAGEAHVAYLPDGKIAGISTRSARCRAANGWMRWTRRGFAA